MTKRTLQVTVIAASVGLANTYGIKKRKHRIVFEVGDEGAEKQQGILKNIENSQKSSGRRTQK